MEFSPQQERALIAVQNWINAGAEEPYYLAGYAGTGKTTLAKHFAEGLGGPVFYAAFTGKAAHVMRRAGCHDARTIHSLIYLPRNKDFRGYEAIEVRVNELEARQPNLADAEIVELSQLRRELEKVNADLKAPAFHLNLESELSGASLLVVDECSMVSRDMGEDLLSFKVPLLVLGDPAQLPPVRGTGYFTSRKPDTLLTEIHRQAKDNPILRIADLIRRGKPVEYGQYGESRVISTTKVSEALDTTDQILVGTNETRRRINLQARKYLLDTVEPTPLPKDKIICLKNSTPLGLMNGSMWEVETVGPRNNLTQQLKIRNPDDGSTQHVAALNAYFEGREKELKFYEDLDGQKFDYGYAITVHKSQGSQWNRVTVLDESKKFPDRGDFARQWLYTAVTRASERLDLVIKEKE